MSLGTLALAVLLFSLGFLWAGFPVPGLWLAIWAFVAGICLLIGERITLGGPRG